jgi:[ribosomal protein S5]-alanine N-acetyltransferase
VKTVHYYGLDLRPENHLPVIGFSLYDHRMSDGDHSATAPAAADAGDPSAARSNDRVAAATRLGVIRPVDLEDAEGLAGLYRANREHLVPFVEIRDQSFFTPEGQHARIARAIEAAAAGESWRFAILDGDSLAGTIGVTNVIRGPVQGAKLGYWVAHGRDGKGLATRAVAEVSRFAFEGAGLHRLEAWTLVDNHASQRVLEKNGFSRFGIARGLLLIDGEWRDHILFERIAE